ncbi:hypothetical protein [Tenacibaculum finnmarkense]|nr:hypothetical protein [Tenacibaculum finnmarkense]MCG8203222.1 hypothetical protein [Tenacibaculum finnmarkense genomovar finnmarkense]MCG8247519.1 hypothetical protein [Tenacibaculum finnmarkense genomovar finnmarkense]MCG8747745.1 hypothetical protein [Tenacibaculum finnmarkense]MCG8768409.1 hypothetical protein [Tenacibaculum finnmarkense]MCM8865977.1 hypothetical protein [Tenacibaculum finnmarkense genomovar finnmarkense]
MKESFKKWLIKNNYSENTVNSYTSALNQISGDLSEKMNSEINLYKIDNLSIIAKFSELYDKTGNFSEFGERGNGTVRNAIRRYFEFLID